MRNANDPWMRLGLVITSVTCITLFAGGCANDAAKSKENLTAGYAALDAKQYDEAINRADEQLKKHPTGAGSAEARYLKGRALEQKPVTTQRDARANLQTARSSYAQALSQSPPAKLQGYIRTSSGNCAYFMDDYAAALSDWTAAYEKLDDPEVKSWVLYRIGLCRQRMGQFDQADQAFAKVQQDYRGTVPAQRAREHQGARGFTLQFATFANPATADSAVNTLRREGVLSTKATDPQGRTVIRVGPLPSYQQALGLKERYASQYPDAMILP